MDTLQPLALVLSGGGARAAYQVGVLRGIEERAGCDVCFPIVTGVSAGAINAAGLSGYQGSFKEAVDQLERMWLEMTIDQVFHSGVLALTRSFVAWLWTLGSGGVSPGFELRGLLNTQPLRTMLSRLLDAGGVDANLASGRLRALAISATSYATGRTVTFLHGAPDVPTWERAGRLAVRTRLDPAQVLASCSLPLLFPAVEVGDEWFGDGSIRQTAPLAPAIHLGATRILAVSLRYGRSVAESAERQVSGFPPPAQVLGMLFNAVFLDALEADAERLERVNRSLASRPEGPAHPEGLRPVRLEVLRPSRDLGKLSSDLSRCLPRSLRILLRGMGSRKLVSTDFMSYLLFERPYIERLLDLGRADALRNWDRIAPLLEPAPATR